MSDEFIPYGSQWVEEDDIDAVADVMRGDWLTTGPTVDEFEEALGETGGATEAVAVNSGTAALHAAYEAAGVGPGTEVVVPALTFSATANVAHHLGADVRFADIDTETLTVDPDSVAALVNQSTAVIAPVDFAGHPADIDSLRDIAEDCGAVVVEDAAHSIGGRYRGDPVGSVADMTCFSFHPVKTITTGEGGAILTDNSEWAGRMRRFRHHGMNGEIDELDGDPSAGGWAYDIETIGHNFRITDIHCALGLSQLQKLDEFVQRRQQIADRYRELMSGLHDVELPPDRPWCSHGYHLFVIRVPPERRKEIFERLRGRGIGVQVHYIPVNMLSAYRKRGHDPEDTPAALRAYRRLISIPCFPKIDDGQIERVVDELREILKTDRSPPSA